MKTSYSEFLKYRTTNSDAAEKLFNLELNKVRKKNILAGVFIGVLISILLILALGSVLWFNQDIVAEKALEYVVSGYLTELFESFPNAYVTYNQHKILPILDGFTNAAARHHVSNREFREIGKSVITALSDKKLTYHEIDAILSNMKAASGKGNNFD